jgi:hypothetical protein
MAACESQSEKASFVFFLELRVIGELLKSRRNRRLIQAATVLLPPVRRKV